MGANEKLGAAMHGATPLEIRQANIIMRCRQLLDRSAPFHLNQDGESGWQCAMDLLEEALGES